MDLIERVSWTIILMVLGALSVATFLQAMVESATLNLFVLVISLVGFGSAAIVYGIRNRGPKEKAP